MSACAINVKVTKTVYVVNGRRGDDSWTERVYENYGDAEKYLVSKGYAFNHLYSTFWPVSQKADCYTRYTVNEYVVY